jgi:AcrR family transcriptional regulator
MVVQSPGSPPPKDRLLAHVLEYFMSDGLGDLSLRHIAAAVGSSHRMLLYHFGSKDGLLFEVVRAVETRTREQLAHLVSAGEVPDTAAAIRAMWGHVADPGQGDFERLFFALYGRGLQGDPYLRPLLRSMTEEWLNANVALSEWRGIPEVVARTHSRLGLAVVRGLLLDLLATGDRDGADAALEQFALRYVGRWWENQPEVSTVSARPS